MAEARRTWPEPSARRTQLAQRARHSASIARAVLAPAQPMDEASIRVAASELYWESAYWALCSLSADASDAVGTVYDATVWDGLDESLLARAVKGSERIEPLRALLRAGSFVYFAELPEAGMPLVCSELQELAQLLGRQLDVRAHALQAKLVERAWRLGLLAFVVLACVVGLRMRAARDLAVDKPWTVSSSNGGAGCVSPAQQCEQSPSFFFHTTEEANPWVEFDLGATQSISGVKVENRRDCCTDRAIPLTVDVSTDHTSWKTVARRAEDFTTWKISFSSVEARWVRLQTKKKTYLHLAEVRILP